MYSSYLDVGSALSSRNDFHPFGSTNSFREENGGQKRQLRDRSR